MRKTGDPAARVRRSAAGAQRRPERDDLCAQPAPELGVEDVPDAVADAGQGCSGEAHAHRRPHEPPQFQPTQLAPQDETCATRSPRSRSPSPQRSRRSRKAYSSRARGDRRDRQVDARYRGRHPRTLEAEERPGQQQEQPVEREREGEPEERRRDQVGGVRPEVAVLVDEPDHRRRQDQDRARRPGRRSSTICRIPFAIVAGGRRIRAAPRGAQASGRSRSSPPPRRCPGGACRCERPCRWPPGRSR